jgi:thiol-disulfide isomerase/thioredoxin
VSYLAGSVVVVGVLAILNLLLTFGVIRRLREHTELISAGGGMGPPDLMVGVGESPGDFTAAAIDGTTVTREALVGGQFVGFFSPDCEPCKEMAPRFAGRAAALPGGRTQVLAVVVGAMDEVEELVALLEPVARVVVEDSLDASGVAGAFKVKGVPAMCTLNDDGVVAASGFDVVELPVPSLAS